MNPLFWVAMAGSALLLGCADVSTAALPQAKARPVVVVQASEEPYAAPVMAAGQLVGSNEAVLSFKVGGLLRRVAVEAGDRVQKGQLLAALDTQEIGAGMNQVQAAYDKAARDWQRVERLFSDQVVTAAQREDAATALEVARSSLQIAQFNARHGRITAPCEGVVLRRLAQENEMVGPGQPIVQVQSGSSDWVVRVGLAERDAVRVQIGDRARVRLSAYEDMALEAVVRELAPSATPGTGTFSAKLALGPTGLRLMSGLIARVEITPSATETLVFVPLGALVEANGEQGSVYVLDPGGTAIRREVQIATVRGERIGIKSGLTKADRVVSVGASYLSSGEPVRLANAEVVP